jgi:hypothetical protein
MGDVFKKVTRPACVVTFESGRPLRQRISVADLPQVPQADKPLEMVDKKRFGSVAQEKLREVPGCLFLTANIEYYSIWAKVNGLPHDKLESWWMTTAFSAELAQT